MPTERRLRKFREVLSKRQPTLRVILDGVSSPHNVSAVLRTCDAVGVLYVYIIDPEGLFRVSRGVSLGSELWLKVEVTKERGPVFEKLKKEGFKIYAAHLVGESVDFRSVDYTGKVALVFGNELEGVSQEALSFADKVIKIPMYGMTQSLNVSVAAAVVLYEAERQRRERGMYRVPQMDREGLEAIYNEWVRRERR